MKSKLSDGITLVQPRNLRACVLFTWTSDGCGLVKKSRQMKKRGRGKKYGESRGRSVNRKWELSVTCPLAAAAAALTWALWMAAGALIYISFLSWLVCGSNAQRLLTWWAELLTWGEERGKKLRARFPCTVWGCQLKGGVEGCVRRWGGGGGVLCNGQRTWMKVKMLWVSMQKQQVTTVQPRAGEK